MRPVHDELPRRRQRRCGIDAARLGTRRERVGELLQMDGSHHDWFEGRGGWSVLMVIIDDATGTIYARFFEAENRNLLADAGRQLP